MEQSMKKRSPDGVDLEQYIVRKSVEDYWRSEEISWMCVNGPECSYVVTVSCSNLDVKFFGYDNGYMNQVNRIEIGENY